MNMQLSPPPTDDGIKMFLVLYCNQDSPGLPLLLHFWLVAYELMCPALYNEQVYSIQHSVLLCSVHIQIAVLSSFR